MNFFQTSGDEEEKKKIKERTSTRDGDGSAAGLFVSMAIFFLCHRKFFTHSSMSTMACGGFSIYVFRLLN